MLCEQCVLYEMHFVFQGKRKVYCPYEDYKILNGECKGFETKEEFENENTRRWGRRFDMEEMTKLRD